MVSMRQAAKKAVLMDSMETQLMHDSQLPDLSPISRLQLELPNDQERTDHDVEMEKDSSGSSTEESAEEELEADDEIVEPVDPHFECVYVVDSDQETLLSPNKGNKPPAPEVVEPVPEVAIDGPGSGSMVVVQNAEPKPAEPEDSHHELGQTGCGGFDGV